MKVYIAKYSSKRDCYGFASKLLKRSSDIVLTLVAMLFLIVPAIVISIIIKLTSRGAVIHFSDRVGVHSTTFKMPKFRTMLPNSPEMATHLLEDPDQFLTPVGKILRKTSLDEIPQLWCILIGKMSIVGPRPALFNQYDLIDLRKKYDIDSVLPGLTGWAQINGRDEISLTEKVQYDRAYVEKMSFLFDLKIIAITARNVLLRVGVSH